MANENQNVVNWERIESSNYTEWELYAVGLFICEQIHKKNISFQILYQNLNGKRILKNYTVHMSTI